jgi:hypothetical protein
VLIFISCRLGLFTLCDDCDDDNDDDDYDDDDDNEND